MKLIFSFWSYAKIIDRKKGVYMRICLELGYKEQVV